jgi:hypothetical protein
LTGENNIGYFQRQLQNLHIPNIIYKDEQQNSHISKSPTIMDIETNLKLYFNEIYSEDGNEKIVNNNGNLNYNGEAP